MPASSIGLGSALEVAPTLAGTIIGHSEPHTPLIRLHGRDGGSITAALEDDSSVTVTATLSGDRGAHLYQLEFGTSLSLLIHAITSNSGTLLELSLREGSWLARLLFPDRTALAEAYGRLDEYGYDPQVTRITSLESIDNPSIAWLTRPRPRRSRWPTNTATSRYHARSPSRN
ncbi:MAG: hypothetical protein U5K37_03050 [Natrialbaceae archaeon]|nr:hypothetical protein [Natrialbaceae archaeon]